MLMAAALMSLGAAARAAELGPAKHKVVIQVSTDNARTQKIALNNAANVQAEYGVDNVDVEVVAYGPGLSLLTDKSGQAKRVESMAMQGVRFSACHNTMEGIKRKTGHMPVLLKGVKVVPAGVGRIMELEEQGYAYIRP